MTLMYDYPVITPTLFYNTEGDFLYVDSKENWVLSDVLKRLCPIRQDIRLYRVPLSDRCTSFIIRKVEITTMIDCILEYGEESPQNHELIYAC
jgi:hypothetical protein